MVTNPGSHRPGVPKSKVGRPGVVEAPEARQAGLLPGVATPEVAEGTPLEFAGFGGTQSGELPASQGPGNEAVSASEKPRRARRNLSPPKMSLQFLSTAPGLRGVTPGLH